MDSKNLVRLHMMTLLLTSKKIDYVKTNTSGLFKHKNHEIFLTLVADDFGIKYKNKARSDVDHLITVIPKRYPIKHIMHPT